MQPLPLPDISNDGGVIDLPEWAPRVSPLERYVLERGTCVGHPHPEWWTETQSKQCSSEDNSRIRKQQTMARHECLRCPVKDECRQVCDEFEADIAGGIHAAFLAAVWAGEGPQDREQRRRWERGIAPRRRYEVAVPDVRERDIESPAVA